MISYEKLKKFAEENGFIFEDKGKIKLKKGLKLIVIEKNSALRCPVKTKNTDRNDAEIVQVAMSYAINN